VPSRSGRPYLHEEIVRIIRSRRNRPVTAEEIADAVNAAGRYEKHDGSLMRPNQIHARVSKHPDLFERTPAGIRLR